MDETRTALITGGARRIGAAIARDLAGHGWAVAIHCNRSTAEAETLARDLRATGGTVAVVAADLTVMEDVERLVDRGHLCQVAGKRILDDFFGRTPAGRGEIL